MWRNMRATTLNSMLQLLVIYRFIQNTSSTSNFPYGTNLRVDLSHIIEK